MLAGFGFAWPVNIYNSLKTKTNEGKSLFFLWIIEFGYASGITHKILYSRDIVLILYIINALMVLTDISIYYWKQRRIDKEKSESTQED
jgi:hypothetical protein